MNKYHSLQPITEEPEYCTAIVYDNVVCGDLIETMCWKGSGVCGDNHRKLKGDAPIMGEPQ